MWAGLKAVTAKAMEGVSKAAFDFYGTASDAYGPLVNDLFTEAYFIEAQIKELSSLPRDRNPNEQVLLSKLTMLANFFFECVLDVVLSDMLVLLDSYLRAIQSKVTAPVSLGV
jgi:hypothetical protein